MPRRRGNNVPFQNRVECPVCSRVFADPQARKSHQRQLGHWVASLPHPPRTTSNPPPESQPNPNSWNDAALAAKKRAKKERQRQRREAQYLQIKEIVLKLIEERGLETVLGLPCSVRQGPTVVDLPVNDPVPSVSTAPPDVAEVDGILGKFIKSLLDKDEENLLNDSDSDSVASDSDIGRVFGNGDSNSDTSECPPDTNLIDDMEGVVNNPLVFEPVVEDGELTQSSIDIGALDSSMADSLAELSLNLADMSIRDMSEPFSPGEDILEPTGDYSFLHASPASSDGTTTPPNTFIEPSMIDLDSANESQLLKHHSQLAPMHIPVGDRSIDTSGSIDMSSENLSNQRLNDMNTPNLPEPGPQWGAPIGKCLPQLHRLHNEKLNAGLTPAHPFADWLEFEFVKWMIEHDISQGSREMLLKLPIIANRACLSFGSNYTLNTLLNQLPTTGPKWDVKAVKIVGDKKGPDGKPLTETVELWHRDVLGVIQELLENHIYGDKLVFAPREEWADAEQTERRYDEMWTADWWRNLLASGKLPPGATILPIILASDATQLTNFGGGKQAYPVYITLGNIPKAIRRKPSSYGTLLLGYLPAEKLECFTKTGKTHQKERLFHQCMTEMLKPLVKAGQDGVDMACGDGKIRRCFPILAAYIADNPEQTQVACCKRNLCYRCTVKEKNRGEYGTFPDRDHVDSANALIARSKDRTTKYYEDNGLRPFGKPFWADLPHCNIYCALTPDLLHQLHKGVFKDHVMKWCLELANVDVTEFNDRYKAMPEHSTLRHFNKNISDLAQTTGKEHREMEKVFLGVMTGLVPNNVMPALHALLDFIYYAQLPTHTETTIVWLERALQRFHDAKEIFKTLGVRQHFNINKLHSMMHYATAIRELGALDGYNTEGPERLHINFAKRAYRATNRNDFIVQMVQYLERREQVFKFDAYLKWAIPEYAAAEKAKDEALAAKKVPGWHIAMKSPFRPVTQDRVHEIFGIRWFDWAIGEFLEREEHPGIQLAPNDPILVYPKATQFLGDHLTLGGGFTDIIHASPHTPTSRLSFEQGSRFDTVLIQKPGTRSEELSYGIHDFIVGQVRMIFTLPKHYRIHEPLVCVYTFDPSGSPTQLNGMYRARRDRYPAVYQNHPIEKVFYLSDVRRTCHLIPDFGRNKHPFYSAARPALDIFDSFYINNYLDMHSHIFFQC